HRHINLLYREKVHPPPLPVSTKAWKLEKNAPEARVLSAGGYRTSVDAFVVSSSAPGTPPTGPPSAAWD
ncbi:hypothetical protein J6590_092583, partial [Homalodisca vitripennis]